MEWELCLFFFCIAFVYASVGFGGGSSYLALLALYSFDYQFLRVTALLCNITVVTGSVYLFHKHGHLRWKKVWPLVVISVPMAYLGGRLPITESFFFILLGFSLAAAAILLWIQSAYMGHTTKSPTKKTHYPFQLGLGGSVGFLSGMVGIGGGIFLSPILHLLRWDKARRIAATASLFILVNSIAGLAGQLTQLGLPESQYSFIALLMASVFLGGQVGVRLGAQRFNAKLIRRLTALLVFLVSVRILYQYLGN